MATASVPTDDPVATESVSPAAKNLFTLADLKANATEKSCYLLIHGKVYNVTDFLEVGWGCSAAAHASHAKT